MRANGGNKHETGEAAEALDAAWRKIESNGWMAGRKPVARSWLRGIAVLNFFAAGKVVYRVGDPADGLYGLVEGALTVTVPRIDGQEVALHRAVPGYWVGDLALVTKRRRLVSLYAAADSLLLHLPQDSVDALLVEHQELVRDFYELSYLNSTVLLQLLGNLAVPGADNRVALRLLMQHDNLDGDPRWIEMSQDELAELVSLSPQSVRRSLHRFVDAGLLEVGYGRVRIRNYEELARRCGYAGDARRTG